MRMKKVVFLFVLFAFSLGFSQNEKLFDEATELYNNGKYSEAIANYEKILDSGQHSAELYFNMGNCYYKLNSIGPSIYYYEKALLLNPNDDEILNNLGYAQNMRLDAIEQMPQTELSRIYNKILFLFTCNQWAYLAIALVLLFVATYLAYYFIRQANRKRMAFITSLFSLGFGLFCILIAYLQLQQNKRDNPAIVFSKEVSVSSEPNKTSEQVFTLHEGTKVNIEDSLDGWEKIRIADGQTGWLPAENIKALKDF